MNELCSVMRSVKITQFMRPIQSRQADGSYFYGIDCTFTANG